MNKIHPPQVAGLFYPRESNKLREMLQEFLFAAKTQDEPIPKAIIAPHAGYIYSGPIATSAYACLSKAKGKITRVVLLAPSHHHAFQGFAFSSADFFATPLGPIPVDTDALEKISALSAVQCLDSAFSYEHSLEVQLPFLQYQLQDFKLVPILTGEASSDEVATILDTLWDGTETLVVISSDLSHYLDYNSAQNLDKRAVSAILTLNPEGLSDEQACGHVAVRGLLQLASEKGLKAKLLDLRNSGDTAGKQAQVVGYGAFHFR
jgi:MEMO1 family protein